ncbi:MAG: SDR family NAD(P)-dependent oxidoreductase [Lewinella sp.]|nr:SDR family NAD(P)-dependent oxidoreductase [Lewinella sp.]
MQLTNHTILITGGTSGIGYALGLALLKKDNTVILLGRNPEKLAAAEKEGFLTLRCDLANLEEVEKAVVTLQNDYPGLNMLFNNAGVQYNYLYAEEVVAPEKIAREVAINLTGQLVLTQQLIPLLSTAERAMIVNTTSGLGAYAKPDGLVYSATKGAMRNFTQGLRDALRDTPIRVLEFIPPVTASAMTAHRPGQKMSPAELVDRVLPQLEKERAIATVPAIRVFLWIAARFPKLAARILSRQD